MADLVICKCGYGFISECLTNGTPFYYIADNNHLEQKAISCELEKQGIFNRLSFEDVSKLNLTCDKIMSMSLNKKECKNEEVSKLILQTLKN